MTTATQSQLILAHLKTGRSITPIYALNAFQCFRLGARIHELKQAGHPIQRDMVPTESGKHVASYSMGADMSNT